MDTGGAQFSAINSLRTGNTINEFQCQSIEDMESYNKMYERVLGGYYRTFAAAMAHLKRIAERAESRSLTVEEVQRADDELKQGGQDTPRGSWQEALT